MIAADFVADLRDGGFDEVGGGPVAPGAADLEDKVADKVAAERGVVDFGMELDGPDAALFVGDAGEGIGA